MHVAFYAPLKAPDHPVPSGDRQMARLLVQALRIGGHQVELMSELRSFCAEPDADRMDAVERRAEQEVDRIARRWQLAPPPDLWFTYHSFYKAPDLLGRDLARVHRIPYALAEASDAPKRAHGAWARWHSANRAAVRAADVHLCFTAQDRSGVAALLGSARRIVDLPPFIGIETPPGLRRQSSEGPVRLVCVAMMRDGDKLRSYASLASALSRLPDLPWHLSVIGDGPSRDAVRRCFAGVGTDRVTWCGQLESQGVQAHLAASDLFVWPGHNEAYGMAYLEAGACGLPVVAFDSGGVASVVQHQQTGLLVADNDLPAFVEALATLIRGPRLRAKLGAAARDLVLRERHVSAAAVVLDRALASAARPRPPVPA